MIENRATSEPDVVLVVEYLYADFAAACRKVIDFAFDKVLATDNDWNYLP